MNCIAQSVAYRIKCIHIAGRIYITERTTPRFSTKIYPPFRVLLVTHDNTGEKQGPTPGLREIRRILKNQYLWPKGDTSIK